MIRNIFAAVDNGTLAKPFLQAAAAFAAQKKASLEIAVLTPAPMASPALAPLGGLYIPDVILMGDDATNLESVKAALVGAACEPQIHGFHDDIAWLAGGIGGGRQIADLILVPARECWETPSLHRRVLETLVRSSGTPLMILPAGTAVPPVRKAVLGWKTSAEAVRALHALVGLIEAGATIDIVTVGMTQEACQRETNSHAEVKRHLARHGLEARGHWIINDVTIEAETLTNYAQSIAADLLVIGGFSHSRMRDIILGSVTRDLVARTDLPTLIVG
jgi:nucleotide-binding universal stress UspA family protein